MDALSLFYFTLGGKRGGVILRVTRGSIQKRNGRTKNEAVRYSRGLIPLTVAFKHKDEAFICVCGKRRRKRRQFFKHSFNLKKIGIRRTMLLRL